MKRLLFIPLMLLCLTGISIANTSQSESNCNIDLGHWLDCNNPVAIEYLKSLTHKDIGKVLSGIMLTDKSVAFQNLTYIGSSDSLGTKAHVYIFSQKIKEAPSIKYIAYIWVDKDGEPLKLPICKEDDPVIYIYHDPHVLSGDVYTWKSIQPGDGVVSTICVPQAWLGAVGFKK